MVEKITKAAEQAQELTKNIWLAGLGAYGRVIEEAQTRYEDLTKKTTAEFDRLVEKGKEFDVAEKLGENNPLAKLAEKNPLAKVSQDAVAQLETRIDRVRDMLGLAPLSATASKLDEILEKLDGLTLRVSKLEKGAKVALTVEKTAPVAEKAAALKAEAAPKVAKTPRAPRKKVAQA